jgi:surfeit locus 1 family protein
MGFDGGFHPKLWPTLIALPLLLVLIGLGLWQLERRDWKQDLTVRLDDRLAAPVMALPGPGADLAAIEFHRTLATGDFLHDREMYLGGRTMAGRAGYHVITPLRLDAGGILLVNRGWIPFDKRSPEGRRLGQVPGQVTIQGVIRRPVSAGWAVPENRPAENEWYSIDMAAMAARAGLDPTKVRRFYVAAGDAPNPGGLPVGGQTRVNLPDNHLQYALVWLALAVVLVVIYALYHRGRASGGETE